MHRLYLKGSSDSVFVGSLPSADLVTEWLEATFGTDEAVCDLSAFENLMFFIYKRIDQSKNSNLQKICKEIFDVRMKHFHNLNRGYQTTIVPVGGASA